MRDTRSGMPGQEAVASVNGPMARTLADLELYCKSVVDGQPWLRDAKCIPLAWRPVRLPARLRVAVMWHDAMVRPTPPVARALRETVASLRAAGHDVVDWDPVDQAEGLSLLARMFVADGGKTIKHELQRTGEPLRPEMEAYGGAEELGTCDMWKLQRARTAFQNRHLDRWNEAAIDAILCPTIPFPTVANGHFKHGQSRATCPRPAPRQPLTSVSRLHRCLQRPRLLGRFLCDRPPRRPQPRQAGRLVPAPERHVQGHQPRVCVWPSRRRPC